MRPGIYDLGTVVITAARTGDVITEGNSVGASVPYVADLGGMSGVALQADFDYGSGGTSVAAYVQTSLDQGQSWIDIASFHFTTADSKKVVNLDSGADSGSFVTTSDGELDGGEAGTDGAVDGILGDRLRVKIDTVGAYAGDTTLSVRASVR